MATRFYVLNTLPSYSPPTPRGAWDQTAQVVFKALDTTKRINDVIASVSLTEADATAEWDVLGVRAVSGPLQAQTISGTVDVCIGHVENTGACDFYWHFHIYALVGSTDVVRGTLLTDYRETTAEFAIGTDYRGLVTPQTLASLAVSAGDRLVVEYGIAARNVTATGMTGAVLFGAPASSADASPGVTGAMWVEFSGTISEDSSTNAARVTAMRAEVMTQLEGPIRVTAMRAEALTQLEGPIRVTAMRAEVLQTAIANKSTDVGQTLFNSFDPNQNSGHIIGPLLGRWGVQCVHAMPVSGTFQNWRGRQPTASGGATTRFFTLYKNGVATTLQLAFAGSATDATDLTHAVNVLAGDLVHIVQSHTGGVPTDGTLMQSALEFVPSDGVSYIYGAWGNTGFSSNPGYSSVGDDQEPQTSEVNRETLWTVPGTITKVYGNWTGAPTSSNTRSITLFKNGVVQDGTSGSPDTRVTITGSATTGNSSPNLTLAANDRLSIRTSATGSPGAGSPTTAFAFVPTTPGQTQITVVTNIDNTSGVTDYLLPTWVTGGTSATEADKELIGPETTITITGMTIQTVAQPGATKSHTITLRKNQTDTAITATIANTATGPVSVVGSVALTSADRWSVKRTNVGTAAGNIVRISFTAAVGSVGGPAAAGAGIWMGDGGGRIWIE